MSPTGYFLRKWKKQPTGQDKIFAKPTSDMGLEVGKSKKNELSPMPLESNSDLQCLGFSSVKFTSDYWHPVV